MKTSFMSCVNAMKGFCLSLTFITVGNDAGLEKRCKKHLREFATYDCKDESSKMIQFTSPTKLGDNDDIEMIVNKIIIILVHFAFVNIHITGMRFDCPLGFDINSFTQGFEVHQRIRKNRLIVEFNKITKEIPYEKIRN